MVITELIEILKNRKESHGDLECYVNGEDGHDWTVPMDPEFVSVGDLEEMTGVKSDIEGDVLHIGGWDLS